VAKRYRETGHASDTNKKTKDFWQKVQAATVYVS